MEYKMKYFVLPGLYRHLLEKIISKLRPKSYFRLLQTCREVGEFIQQSGNISVFIDGTFLLEFPNKRHGCRIARYIRSNRVTHYIPFKALLGTRLEILEVGENKQSKMNEVCDVLKRNRITCSIVKVVYDEDAEVWSKAQCLTLLDTLKPMGIDATGGLQENTFDAILDPAAHIRKLSILTDNYTQKEAIVLIKDLISTIQELDFYFVYGSEKFPSMLMREVLKLFRKEQLPTLQSFNLVVQEKSGLPGELEVETTNLQLPEHFPAGSLYMMAVGTQADYHGEDRTFNMISFYREEN